MTVTRACDRDRDPPAARRRVAWRRAQGPQAVKQFRHTQAQGQLLPPVQARGSVKFTSEALATVPGVSLSLPGGTDSEAASHVTRTRSLPRTQAPIPSPSLRYTITDTVYTIYLTTSKITASTLKITSENQSYP